MDVIARLALEALDHCPDLASGNSRSTAGTTKNVRIVFVLEEARVDGTIRFFARQVRRLQTRGHDVTVACAPGMLQAHFEPANLALIDELSPNGPPPDGNLLRRIATLCKHADLVMAAAGRAFPAVVQAEIEVPYFLDILSNDLFVGDDPSVVEALLEAGRHGRIIAHSLDDALAYGERYGLALKDVRFVPLPIDRGEAAEIRPRVAFAAPDEMFILTAARLDDDHIAYVEPLMRAILTLRNAGYPVRLAVVGDGTHGRRLMETSLPGIDFLGFRHDLDAIYPLADIYVGEGSSRLEAALAGVPVISSCAQTQPKLAESALFLYGMQHGTLHGYSPCAAIPPTPFATAIGLLLDDQVLRTRVAERGCERVRTVHHPESFVTFIEQLGKPDAGRLPSYEPAHRTITVPASHDAIVAAAREAAADRRLGIVTAGEVAWRDFAALPDDLWDPLSDAVRRTQIPHAIEQGTSMSPDASERRENLSTM